MFSYTASDHSSEDHVESGTIVSQSEDEARKKLRQFKFDRIHLRRLRGLSALFRRFTANIR